MSSSAVTFRAFCEENQILATAMGAKAQIPEGHGHRSSSGCRLGAPVRRVEGLAGGTPITQRHPRVGFQGFFHSFRGFPTVFLQDSRNTHSTLSQQLHWEHCQESPAWLSLLVTTANPNPANPAAASPVQLPASAGTANPK